MFSLVFVPPCIWILVEVSCQQKMHSNTFYIGLLYALPVRHYKTPLHRGRSKNCQRSCLGYEFQVVEKNKTMFRFGNNCQLSSTNKGDKFQQLNDAPQGMFYSQVLTFICLLSPQREWELALLRTLLGLFGLNPFAWTHRVSLSATHPPTLPLP